MPSINFCFRIHQPYQFKSYCFDDIGKLHLYEDKVAMAAIMDELAENCYLPANRIILQQIRKHRGAFRVAFSISGTTLELFEQFRPDIILSFRQLVDTGCVELLAETYYNSYSWLHSRQEFDRQLAAHADLVKKLFNYEPVVLRNTELMYEDELARHIAALGYQGMFIDGNAAALNGRSPNQVYAAPDNSDFALLLRNTNLSEDIACLYGMARASRYALTADKFAERVFRDHPADSCCINLFLDYETFGIYRTGPAIFRFLEELPAAILVNPACGFKTPSEVIGQCYPRALYHMPEPRLQQNSIVKDEQVCAAIQHNQLLNKLYKLEKLVMESGEEKLLNTWGRLQSAEHFCFIAGSPELPVHHYHYESLANYTVEKYQQIANILTDFEISLITAGVEKSKRRFRQHLSFMLF